MPGFTLMPQSARIADGAVPRSADIEVEDQSGVVVLPRRRHGGPAQSSPRGVLLPGALDGVPHMGGVLRTPAAEYLEVEILLESLEQPLPSPEDNRHGGDRELVDHTRRQALANQVGTIPEGDPAVASELARLPQRGVEAVNEQEAPLRIGLIHGAVGQHDQRAGNGLVPPSSGILVAMALSVLALRLARCTCAPSRAYARATAEPIAPAAP
jgi:hypothetical protein